MPDRKAYLLRIDPDLWAEIERLAQSELRSVNGQVEYLLRDALERRGIHAAGTASSGGLTRRNSRHNRKS